MDIKNTANRKPRQTRGTPSYRYRNYFAFSIFAVSGLMWWAYSLSPLNEIAKQKVQPVLHRSVQDEERRELFRLNRVKTGEQILEIIDQAEEFKQK